MAARCDAAGRPENEDNFQVAEDLSVSNNSFTKDKVFSLGSKGALLLVCDGMGGMNAGEVASKIGVDTIKDLFSSQSLTSDIFANDDSICAYMKRAIIKADSRIKEEASKDEAKRGMGSTVVMAWLLGHKVYVAWCGDSRCYRYNPATGLEQLSHDHSYVQDLVDSGQLLPNLAFDHPNKNIITRSLGDPRGAAKPDTKVYNLQVGDVILLCSDGLNDSLRDSEIEQAISRSLNSMVVCLETLWNDSRQAGWHDNVTIVLAQVVDEETTQAQTRQVQQPTSPSKQQSGSTQMPAVEGANGPKSAQITPTSPPIPLRTGKKTWRLVSIIVIVLALLAGGTIVVRALYNKHQKDEYNKHQKDELYMKLKQLTFNKGCYTDTLKNYVKKYKDEYAPIESDSTLKKEVQNHLEVIIDSVANFIDDSPSTKKTAQDIRNLKNELKDN